MATYVLDPFPLKNKLPRQNFIRNTKYYLTNIFHKNIYLSYCYRGKESLVQILKITNYELFT